MKILVLNCGSSSVKYKLIDMTDNKTLAEGGVEKVGMDGTFLKFKKADGSKEIVELGKADHKQSVMAILKNLTDPKVGCIKSFDEIEAKNVIHSLRFTIRQTLSALKLSKLSFPTYHKLASLTPHSIKRCPPRASCIPSPTNFMRKMKFADMVSTEQATAMYRHAFARYSTVISTLKKSSPATSVTVVQSQPYLTARALTHQWDLLQPKVS